MGFFSDFFTTIFSSSGSDCGEDTDIKYGVRNDDMSVIQAHRFTNLPDNTHVHESYEINPSTGAYKEYRGGENAHDRGYNKQ